VLIIDDILLFPVRSLLFIFREIQHAAQQDVANEAESIRTELSELYMMLETGQITEEEFNTQEETLLQMLDELALTTPTVRSDDQPRDDTADAREESEGVN
jgi:hypothetical protein